MTKEEVLKCYDVAMNQLPFQKLRKFGNPDYSPNVSVGIYDENTIGVRCHPSRGYGWIINFFFALRPWKAPGFAKKGTKIRVHSGFLNAWMKMRNEVFEYIKTFNKPNLIVGGASQGGGLAGLVALDIAINTGIDFNNVLGVDFFGPKSINKYGKKSIESRLPNFKKVMYGNDIVCKVVPWYSYIGKMLRIGPKYYWWLISVLDHAMAFANISKTRKLIEKKFN